MTEKVINGLPEILKAHISTLERVSRDTTNRVSMCESKLEVVHFDKIPKVFARDKGWSNFPSSNDALYIAADGSWYFIEFKNGSIDKSDIFKKLYDSLLMMLETGVLQDFQFVRDHVCYILVYNTEKYPRVQKSESRSQNYEYIMKRANQEERLFDVDKFEGYLFRRTYTYSRERFVENFVRVMESLERQENDSRQALFVDR